MSLRGQILENGYTRSSHELDQVMDWLKSQGVESFRDLVGVCDLHLFPGADKLDCESLEFLESIAKVRTVLARV